MAFYVAGGGGVFCGGVAIESIGSEARAPGDRNSVFLFLYEAIHELVASVSGIRAGDFTGGGVDRRYRRVRRVDGRFFCGGMAVGGGAWCVFWGPWGLIGGSGATIFSFPEVRGRQSLARRAGGGRPRRCG